MKVAIMGYSGSGKSTLAKVLATRNGLALLYLDTVQFEPGWKERDRAQATAMVEDFLRRSDWVIDGTYPQFSLERRLEEADMIILLLFNRYNCLLRALRRFWMFRNTTRESQADGCIEKMDLEFIWWILHKGRNRKHRRRYDYIRQTYGAKTTVLKNQKQLNRFLSKQK